MGKEGLEPVSYLERATPKELRMFGCSPQVVFYPGATPFLVCVMTFIYIKTLILKSSRTSSLYEI